MFARRCIPKLTQFLPRRNITMPGAAASFQLGILPPVFCSKTHADRSLFQLRAKQAGLEKYVYLDALKGRDPDLYYKLLIENMPEIIPLIYTPLVGDACLQYSSIWRRPEGLYVSLNDKGNIREVLKKWPAASNARIAVVTDGSRILGLGDLGANGMPIPLGKLDLYIAGAGVDPSTTIPICIDFGTDNQKYLADPLYIGLKQARPSDAVMTEFMEEFMAAMKDVFPQLMVQFEDFATTRAFEYLARFRDRYLCFNDDIQGTGAVVLSGFYNAARLSSAASGLPLTDHKVLFFGAGSAGIGVAKQLMSFYTLQGLSEEEAKSRIWTVDSKGLITADRKGLQDHKHYFARTDYTGPPLKSLLDIINYVKPTALLGLSTIKNAFTKDVVEAMTKYNTRPIVFPLSNPVALTEVTFEDAVKWTDGKVIFASGSPQPPVTYNGRHLEPGQGNNMYVFPAIGLGTVICKATRVTDAMIEQASLALAHSLTESEHASGLIYPRLLRIRKVSEDIALAVVRAAQKDGVDEMKLLRSLSDHDIKAHIAASMWSPATKSVL